MSVVVFPAELREICADVENTIRATAGDGKGWDRLGVIRREFDAMAADVAILDDREQDQITAALSIKIAAILLPFRIKAATMALDQILLETPTVVAHHDIQAKFFAKCRLAKAAYEDVVRHNV